MAVQDARFDGLGQSLFDLVPDTAEKTFLYVEFDDGVISPSVFYKENTTVHYVFCDDPVFDELQLLQDVFGPQVRAMEFVMVGERFTTHFTYGDGGIDFEGKKARCDAALVKVFGHSDASYPSL